MRGTHTFAQTGVIMSDKTTRPALSEPKGVDRQWKEKIAAAHRARELATEARVGKPSSFRSQVGRVAS